MLVPPVPAPNSISRIVSVGSSVPRAATSVATVSETTALKRSAMGLAR